MNRMLHVAVWLVLSVFASAAVAQTMDFEDFPDTAECPEGAAGVTQNGLRIGDNTPFPEFPDDSCVFGSTLAPSLADNGGTNIFGWCGECNPDPLVLTLEREDGAPFDLLSIDFNTLSEDSGTEGVVNITGFPAAGGTPILVQHTIEMNALVTVNFTQLNNVERVEIAFDESPSIDGMLDNIVTATAGGSTNPTAIPVMSPFGLSLLGLLVLVTALLRMRRQYQ